MQPLFARKFGDDHIGHKPYWPHVISISTTTVKFMYCRLFNPDLYCFLKL